MEKQRSAGLNLEAMSAEIRARFCDVHEQAAICALARGETEVRVTVPMLCPCGVWDCQRVDLGPAGWRCGYCMEPAEAPNA